MKNTKAKKDIRQARYYPRNKRSWKFTRDRM